MTGSIHPSSGVPDLTTNDPQWGHVRVPVGPLLKDAKISRKLDMLKSVPSGARY
ncbi:MAG TPA: hypothetical protein VFE96_06955 [Candidatus Bathyarchaeia archaeon]|nr:hypothetical protein [Candidatus Bathyarchaeia archaeon]